MINHNNSNNICNYRIYIAKLNIICPFHSEIINNLVPFCSFDSDL